MARLFNPDNYVNIQNEASKISQYGNAIVQAASSIIGMTDKSTSEYQEIKNYFDTYSEKLKVAVDSLRNQIG